MSSHSHIAALLVLLVAFPSFAAATPKERIAWLPNGHHTLELYLADSDGSNERPFLSGSGSNYNPFFSWDGQWIVFTSERFGSADIFRVHPDGSGLERLTDDPAFDDQGALSPDGRTLAFVSTRAGGTANIWLLNIATHKFHNLTGNKAGNFRPMWSPDGNWIAFSSDRDTLRVRYIRDSGPAWELMQTTAIYLQHPDGSGLRRLTPLEGSAASPHWSPDGRRVIFNQVLDVEAMRHFHLQTQIVSEDIHTGAKDVHTDGKQYVWSPAYVGSAEIAYEHDYPRDGKGNTIVYFSGRTGPADAENASWSPDGKLVIYDKDATSPPGPMEMRLSRDPRYELITGAPFDHEFVPFTHDGKYFIDAPNIAQGAKQIRFAQLDGTALPAIFDTSQDDRLVGSVTLSADDHTLAFEVRNPKLPEEMTQIVTIQSNGSHFRVLTHDHNYNNFPSLSPDGARLVYRASAIENGKRIERGLRIISLADRKIVNLTTGWDNAPAWSPTGGRIAFTGFESGDFEIYTIRPDGKGLRQLTHTVGNDAHPVWSPDGRWIAFVSSRMGWKDEALLPWHEFQSYGEIFVMRSDGSDVRQLTDNQWEEGAVGWVPPAYGKAVRSDADGRSR